MTGSRPQDYGDSHADVYDRLYGGRFAPETAVAALAAAAGAGGRVLELGSGTGRLAIPLAARGVHVDGIEASAAMIRRLRARPGGERVGMFRCDLAGFRLPRHDYDVAVCAVSTLFMLPGRAAQQRCLDSAAHHLRAGGRLFVEAFRPDPGRFDADGDRVETRPAPPGSTHVVRSHHDPDRSLVHISHELAGPGGTEAYGVDLYYLQPDQIDALAASAGLQRTARWHDWDGTAATAASRDPITVYTRSAATPAPS